MKLRKSKTETGYTLSFDISAQEAQRVELFLTWHSDNIKDYIDLLGKLANMPKQKVYTNIFDDYFWKAVDESFSGKPPFQTEPLDKRQYAHRRNTPPPVPEPLWVKVLGLKPTATKTEIRAKYRQLAKKNHPDKGGDALEFAAITAAYDEAMAA